MENHEGSDSGKLCDGRRGLGLVRGKGTGAGHHQLCAHRLRDIAPRIGDAELVLINKCRIDEAVLAQCPNLKWVGIIATGTDNIDLEACRRHGVAVANVPGYSTYSVAQMTFSCCWPSASAPSGTTGR